MKKKYKSYIQFKVKIIVLIQWRFNNTEGLLKSTINLLVKFNGRYPLLHIGSTKINKTYQYKMTEIYKEPADSDIPGRPL